MVRSYDVLGDIAITIIPPELQHRELLIGEAILESNCNIKVVAKRNGTYNGTYRTIPLSIIAGENRKETIHKEYGVKLCLNPEKVYFSVRSGNERKRIADLITPGENVLVMFSGVAPFPLIIARHSQAQTITGIELNEIAHDFAIHNLTLNKATGKVTLYHGDVRNIAPQLNRDFDRIIMPLPKSGQEFLPLAIDLLKKGGWIHFYDFQSPDLYCQSVSLVQKVCVGKNRRLASTETTTCGHCTPRIYRICVDAKVT